MLIRQAALSMLVFLAPLGSQGALQDENKETCYTYKRYEARDKLRDSRQGACMKDLIVRKLFVNRKTPETQQFDVLVVWIETLPF